MKNLAKALILSTTCLIANDPANPSEQAKQNASKNPFTLVYQGAIRENQKGKVQIQKVSYLTSNGIKVYANLYTPPHFDPKKKYPSLVVAHPNGGVKEQVAGLYAQNLAELGYITLAFDAAYQGESEGNPRNVDKPSNRVEDIHSAIDFLSSFVGADSSRLGILGICGGGGYTLKASQTDKRIKAVATLSMFNSGIVRRNGFLDSQVDSIQERMQSASQARSNQGEIRYIGSAPQKMSQAELAKIPTDLYREGVIYYGDTHAHPNSTFAYTESSLLELMSFDATDGIKLLNQPLLMIIGDKADSAYMSEQVFEKAGSDNKQLHRIKDTTHIQTYYKKEAVDEALAELKKFFGKYL